VRMRRYRRRKRVTRSVTVGVTVMDAAAMAKLAARLGNGRGSPGDMLVAGQLITELVDRLPPGYELPILIGT
jgi:hypothetical protein